MARGPASACSCRVTVDQLVLNGVVDNRREGVDQLAKGSRSEGDRPASPAVANVRAGGQRSAQLLRLSELVRLEREAALAVDAVEAVLGEERKQMTADPPAVVGLRVGVDWLGTEDAIDLGLKPARSVRVKRGGLAWLGWPRALRGGHRRGPHAGKYARDDVAQLAARCALVPAAATSAFAPVALVEHDGVALIVGAEAETEGPRTVRQRPQVRLGRRVAVHERRPHTGLRRRFDAT